MNNTDELEVTDYLEFLVAPIPPDTVATVKAEISPMTRRALTKSGHARLWDEREIQVEVEKTLSLEEELVVVGVQLLTAVAVKTFETLVLCRWKERFEVRRQESRRRKRPGKGEGESKR